MTRLLARVVGERSRQNSMYASDPLRQLRNPVSSPPHVPSPSSICMSNISGVPNVQSPSAWGMNDMGRRVEAQANRPSIHRDVYKYRYQYIYIYMYIYVPVIAAPIHTAHALAPALAPTAIPPVLCTACGTACSWTTQGIA